MLNVKKLIMTCKSSAITSNICVLLHAMSQCLDPVGNFKKKKKSLKSKETKHLRKSDPRFQMRTPPPPPKPVC